MIGAAAPRSHPVRLVAVLLGAAAVNVILFSLADVLTRDRRFVQDVTEPIPVALVELPPPPEAPPPAEEEIPEPESRPELDFRPELAPPVPGTVKLDAIAVTVDPDFAATDFDAAALVFAAGDLDTPPRVRTRTDPIFPYRARQRNISGSVTVKLRVEADGSVGSVEILAAEPEGYFEDSVSRTVPGWTFEPGRIAGRAVASWVVTTILFEAEG